MIRADLVTVADILNDTRQIGVLVFSCSDKEYKQLILDIDLENNLINYYVKLNDKLQLHTHGLFDAVKFYNTIILQ